MDGPKAIHQFDEDRGQEVNMRVGIHTGTVMCGIVGTKRFKFDVFSNDVTLANTMESSGLSGRVHVSQTTAGFLTDLYELEEAESCAGMKTYFIAGIKGGTSEEGQDSSSTADLKDIDKTEDDEEGECKQSSGFWGDVVESRKSASLQALSTSPVGPAPLAPVRSLQSAPPVNGSGKYLNKELANGSSGSRSIASLGEKGSRSSGLADDQQTRALDSVAAHAASMTRFETDHRDFDRRLADVIQGSDLAKGGYWIYTRMLNPWTLKFRDPSVESEYRHHFAAGLPTPSLIQQSSSEEGGAGHYGAPKYSVAIDILVATLVHFTVSVTAFAVFKIVSLPWIIYFVVSGLLALAILFGVGIPLWKQKRLVSCVTYWVPRHIIGLALIALPIGIIFKLRDTFSSS